MIRFITEQERGMLALGLAALFHFAHIIAKDKKTVKESVLEGDNFVKAAEKHLNQEWKP